VNPLSKILLGIPVNFLLLSLFAFKSTVNGLFLSTAICATWRISSKSCPDSSMAAALENAVIMVTINTTEIILLNTALSLL